MNSMIIHHRTINNFNFFFNFNHPPPPPLRLRLRLLHRKHPIIIPSTQSRPSSSSSSSTTTTLDHLHHLPFEEHPIEPSTTQPPPQLTQSISAHLSSIFSSHSSPSSLQIQPLDDPPSDSFPLLRSSILSTPSSSSSFSSSVDLDYLKQLSDSLSSRSYLQLSSLSFSHLLHHLQSHDLFKFLSPRSFELLLDFNPSSELHQPSEPSTHHHYYLYHRIFFLLDRIYELKHLFNPSQLDRLHSISLNRFAAVGLFRPAELVWDQMIIPSSCHSAQPRTYDQILMIDCIRTASLNWYRYSNQPDQNPRKNQNYHHHDQESLSLDSKDLKRMINLTDSLGKALTSSSPSQLLDPITERWTVRTVAEIFATQGELVRLSDWLKDQRGLDLHFPDHGASWTDRKITAAVVRAFKDQNKLEEMVKTYEAARYPSRMMLNHPSTIRPTVFVVESSSTDPPPLPSQQYYSIDDRSSSHPPQKINPILTRTYHDLISACGRANRPHLAIHYLTQAIETNEAYVRALPDPPIRPPGIPPLRLQPATFADLIPNLVRKRRDTQLRSVLDLTNRLIRSTVEELDWIRTYALHQASHDHSPRDSSKWEDVLNSILPNFNPSHHHHSGDLKTCKTENTSLERLVFGRDRPPRPRVIEATRPKQEQEQEEIEPMEFDLEDDQSRMSVGGRQRHPQRQEGALEMMMDLEYLRILERTKFLTRSVTHAIRLVDRLTHLIEKTRVNRKLRFQGYLSNQKVKKSYDLNTLQNLKKNHHQTNSPDRSTTIGHHQKLGNHPTRFDFFSSSSSSRASDHPLKSPSPCPAIQTRIQALLIQKHRLKHGGSASSLDGGRGAPSSSFSSSSSEMD